MGSSHKLEVCTGKQNLCTCTKLMGAALSPSGGPRDLARQDHLSGLLPRNILVPAAGAGATVRVFCLVVPAGWHDD